MKQVMEIFVELSIIIIFATCLAVVMKLLKQPFVVGYILTGILVGPHALNILHATESLEFFSKTGIAILLFIVGIHLNPTVLKDIGKTSIIGGVLQGALTSAAGIGICLALGLPLTTAIIVAVALTFSSTIIILKILSDKGDLDAVYGKVSIGILLVQDFIAAIALVAVTSNGDFSLIALKAILLTAVLVATNRLLIPSLTQFMASSSELLFVFSLAWGMGVGAVFYKLGFSAEIGALAAGVALSTTNFADEVGARLKPLRDFFVLLFFVLLGAELDLSDANHVLMPALALSLFVILGKPIIMYLLMSLLHFGRRNRFLVSLTFSQISEFSIVLVALALSTNLVPEDILSLITLVALITIALSSYLVLYSEFIYRRLTPILKRLDFVSIKKEKKLNEKPIYEAVLFGYDRVGTTFVEAIKSLHIPYVVVDYDPKSIKRLKTNDLPYAFGDADDVEFVEELGLASIKIAVSTVPDINTNKLLIKKILQANPKAIIIMLAHNAQSAKELYKTGATYVVVPHYLGAEFASQMITKHGLEKAKFLKEQELHQKKLAKHAS